MKVFFTPSGGVRLPPHTTGVPTGLPYIEVEEPSVPPPIPNIERARAQRNIKVAERKHATPKKRSKEMLLLSQKDSLLASLDDILKGKEESNVDR